MYTASKNISIKIPILKFFIYFDLIEENMRFSLEINARDDYTYFNPRFVKYFKIEIYEKKFAKNSARRNRQIFSKSLVNLNFLKFRLRCKKKVAQLLKNNFNKLKLFKHHKT